MAQLVIRPERFTHAVTFTTEKQVRTEIFSARYYYKWALKAECKECGWFSYITRNGDGLFGDDCSLTQRDNDELLQKHHLGHGMFAVPRGEGKVGNNLFFVDEENERWAMKHGKRGWELHPIT